MLIDVSEWPQGIFIVRVLYDQGALVKSLSRTSGAVELSRPEFRISNWQNHFIKMGKVQEKWEIGE